LLLVALTLGGCRLFAADTDVAGFGTTNRTDEAVDIVYINDVGPGEEGVVYEDLDTLSYVYVTDMFRTDICMGGVLIARDQAGDEVARRHGEICLPGEWIIEAPRPSPT